jgi:predicted nucleic acid-binding protein
VWVFDTSALVRLYVPDGPIPEGAEAALEKAWAGDGALVVPELALAEAAQVLLKKEQAGSLRQEEAEGILADLLSLPLEVVGHADLVATALALGRRFDLTAYDGIFLALALARGASLLTADEDLAAAFGQASRTPGG